MPSATELIIQNARKYGIDPAAALAVARGEGGLVNRAGDVGDLAGGGSYGPFQLYAQGALPAAFRKRPKAADKWAWSPAGIEYAIRKMSEVGASGLKGEAAVEAIIKNFEKPKDPDTSIKNAIARLGSSRVQPVSAPLHATVPNAAFPGVPQRTMVTLNSIFRKAGLPEIQGLGDYKIGGGVAAAAAPGTPQPRSFPTVAKKGKVARMPRPQRMVGLIEYAQNLGLTVTENPYTDGNLASSHVKGSHHYQTVGTHKGKKVGRAIDVSGDPAKLRAFFTYAEQFAGRGLNDLFYDPMGYSYDNGKKWEETIGGHGGHVHLSIR